MLTPEVAKQRLEQWQLRQEDADDNGHDVLVTKAGRLPKSLRSIAYLLLGRDADGKEPDGQYPVGRWRRQPKDCAELDAWPPAQRLRLFHEFLPNLAEQLELGWQFLKAAPYAQGYARKAFRSPNQEKTTLPKRQEWLAGLLNLSGSYQGEALTPSWLACWAPHLGPRWPDPQDAIGQLLAAVIDAGGPLADEVFEILAQSLRNEHEIGGMGRHVTRALLLSSRPDGWELVEKTLLAAQRQEGLRQIILETIDESHPQAFRRMLRLILEHDLARFSAVARAVNVWFGFGWDSASVGKINAAMERVSQLLDDDDVRQLALQGKDAEDVFFALWCRAFEDAHAAIPVAAKLLQHSKVEHRYVAAVHLAQLGLPESQAALLPALDDADLRVAWAAFNGLPLTADETNDSKVGKSLFESLEQLYQRVPEKPTITTKPLVWPWGIAILNRVYVSDRIFHLLGERPPTRLLPYLPPSILTIANKSLRCWPSRKNGTSSRGIHCSIWRATWAPMCVRRVTRRWRNCHCSVAKRLGLKATSLAQRATFAVERLAYLLSKTIATPL
jgi:hypothetical protein